MGSPVKAILDNEDEGLFLPMRNEKIIFKWKGYDIC